MSISSAFDAFMSEAFDAALEKGCRLVMLFEDGSYEPCNARVFGRNGSGITLSLPVLDREDEDLDLRYNNAKDAMLDCFEGFCSLAGINPGL